VIPYARRRYRPPGTCLSTSTPRGELFIVSAPSGSGKTTLIQSLLSSGACGGLTFSVSHTTRRPRGEEVDGRDYHFVDLATFQAMIAADAFLEWAEVHNNYYGTSLAEVLPRLEQGIDVVLDIDVQGAERVLAHHPEAHGIFIMPPSYEDLELRLRRRGLDDPGVIARRLAVSLREIRHYDRYHYVIINDDARRASEALAAIILEKRHRRDRMLSRIEDVLESFRDRGPSP
jgi:guanylate kinase